MARVPVASPWGPNPQLGVRRPDRSVSLPSEPPLPPMVDPRKAAAATGGAIWFYGGYGNPPQKQIGPKSWGPAEGEYRKLADAVRKTAAEVGESVDSADPEEVMNWLGKGLPTGVAEPTWVEVTPDGTVVRVPEPDPEAWVPDPDAVPEVVPEVVPPAVGGPLLAQGLTADQVSPQHQAMGVADSAAAASRRFKEGFERVEAVIARGDDRLDATAERWRERLRGRRAPGAEDVNPQSQMSGGAWKALLSGKLPPILSEPGPLAPAEPPGQGIEELEAMLEPGDPQSQMSQTMLADRFAQQRAQPQQGYFGSTGTAMGGMASGVNEWVQGMSNADRIALISLLLAGGAAATGVGSPLAPLIIGGGAALAGQP